jgi:hypothetical protein
MLDDEVVDIEWIAFDGEVFNMEVEDDNSYVLNGIITHNCLCYKTAVQMSPDEFAKRMKGWVNQPAGSGQAAWPAMDDYAQSIGGIESRLEKTIGDALAKWLFALAAELKKVIG